MHIRRAPNWQLDNVVRRWEVRQGSLGPTCRIRASQEVWCTCSSKWKRHTLVTNCVVGQPTFWVGDTEVSNDRFEGQLVSGPCPHLQANFSVLAPQSVKNREEVSTILMLNPVTMDSSLVFRPPCREKPFSWSSECVHTFLRCFDRGGFCGPNLATHRRNYVDWESFFLCFILFTPTSVTAWICCE